MMTYLFQCNVTLAGNLTSLPMTFVRPGLYCSYPEVKALLANGVLSIF